MEEKTVGMIGLGLMGLQMGRRFLRQGYTVYGYDINEANLASLVGEGAVACTSPADVASRTQAIVLSVPEGPISHAVCLGPEGVRAGARPGTVVVDTTTMRPDEAVALADELASAGITIFDVGVSGRNTTIIDGGLSSMVGGPVEQYPIAERILGELCYEVVRIGEHGDGMRVKLVVNHVLTINRFALAEGLVLAEKMGMDLDQVLSVLQNSAAKSHAMEMWGQRMVDGDHVGPTSRVRGHNMRMQLILELGRQHGAPMLAMATVNHVVQASLANGMGELDNSCLIEILRRLAGVGRIPPDAVFPADTGESVVGD